MDTPENPLVIHVLFLLDGPISVDAVRQLVRERLLTEPRFGRRVVPALGLPRWEEDPSFDLARHVRRAELPNDDPDALERFTSRRMSEPLGRDRPLWTVDVVERWQGRGAMLVKVHHCIGDGVTLVRLLLRLTEQHGSRPRDVGLPRADRSGGLAARVRRGLMHGRTLAKLLLLSQDSPSPFRGPLGSDKRVAWSRPFPVESVAQAAHRQGGTLNDLAMAAVSGAVRRGLEELGALRPDVHLRALSPVFLQGDDDDGPGNHFGLVYVPLPVHSPEPSGRLQELERTMQEIKRSDEASVAFAVLGAMGLFSRRLERLGVRLFTGKASFLVTNVPGPVEPVRLAGAGVEDMIVWAPVSGVIGTGLTLLSYAGRLRLAVSSNARLRVDPHRLASLFEDELDGLLTQAG